MIESAYKSDLKTLEEIKEELVAELTEEFGMQHDGSYEWSYTKSKNPLLVAVFSINGTEYAIISKKAFCMGHGPTSDWIA